MKISQMTTDQAADALIRIAEPAANIMHDEETLKVLEQMAKSKDTNGLSFFADNIVPISTVLLKTHRSDVYEVISALNGKNTEDIGKQKFTETIRDIRDCWDGELTDFFGSLKG